MLGGRGTQIRLSSLHRSSGSGNAAQGASAEATDPSGSADSRGKRKKPTVDLSSIEDPAERRKQRRLAKNRATAAVSRCALLLPEKHRHACASPCTLAVHSERSPARGLICPSTCSHQHVVHSSARRVFASQAATTQAMLTVVHGGLDACRCHTKDTVFPLPLSTSDLVRATELSVMAKFTHRHL